MVADRGTACLDQFTQTSECDGRLQTPSKILMAQLSNSRRPRDAMIVRNREAKRQIGGVTNADARGNLWRRTDKAIVAKLKRRCRIQQVKSVVFGTRNAKRPAQFPRPAGKLCCG